MSAKHPIVNPAEGLVHPTTLVVVPREMRDFYWHQPWVDVVAAAEAGKDSLAFWNFDVATNPLASVAGRPHHWGGREGERDPNPPNVAFLAEGLDDFKGQTVLYQQNYTDKGQQ